MGSEIKVLPKEREMGRISLEDIEEAYLGLMNAYSMCLASLIVDKCKRRHYMVPLTLRWRTKKRVDMLRVTLLLLIAAEKKESLDQGNDSKIIKRFGLYCEDMKSFSDQIVNSGYMGVLKASSPPIILLLSSLIKYLIDLTNGMSENLDLGRFQHILDSFYNLLLLWIIIVIMVFFAEMILIIVLLIFSFVEAGHIFNTFEIKEKDKHFYKLVKDYSSNN